MIISVLFTKTSGQPATGLVLAEIEITLYRRTRTTGATSTVVNAANPTEEVGGGIYTRGYTGEDTETYTYHGWAEYTGVTVLDSNYSLQAGESNAPVSEVADAVWDEVAADHVVVGSTGKLLTDAGGVVNLEDIADAVWDEIMDDHQGPSGAGEYLEGIGRFEGTGINTIKGFLQAIMRDDLAVPSEVGGDYDPADHSIQSTTVSAGAVADAVWEDALSEHLNTSTFGGEMQALAKLTELQAEITALQTALTAAVNGLNNVAVSDVRGASVDALNDYGPATSGEVAGLTTQIPAGVWGYSGTRALTHGSVPDTSIDDENRIVKYIGDTWTETISNVAGLAGADDVLFVIKAKKSDPDSKALAMISQQAGLVYWSGAAATVAAQGTLTVDAVAETVLFRISEAVTGGATEATYYWGVKIIDTDGDKLTRASGTFAALSARVNATEVQG